jgi:hypothetical protein
LEIVIASGESRTLQGGLPRGGPVVEIDDSKPAFLEKLRGRNQGIEELGPVLRHQRKHISGNVQFLANDFRDGRCRGASDVDQKCLSKSAPSIAP